MTQGIECWVWLLYNENPILRIKQIFWIGTMTQIFIAAASMLCAEESGVDSKTELAFTKPSVETTSVSPDVLQEVYNEAKTPFKYGVVLKGGEDETIDCPSVFRHGDKWYMVYIGIKSEIGYETYLAESEDLLHWKRLGKILSFASDGWDQWQAAGTVALQNFSWGEDLKLKQFQGRYWMTYIGGALKGYETDPLSIGVAQTSEPGKATEWARVDENPVLTPNQSDVRFFEETTLYRSNVIWDENETLGHPFVVYYNGKDAAGRGHERIGMAVSDDMRHWKRYGDEHVIYNGPDSQWSISGDPQIVKMGDLWVMFYFGAFWKPDAFDTFACSWDMVNWTKWDGPHLVEPSESWDQQFAHKPWIIKHDGVVYHYYCAVGSEGRVIALATSKDLRNHTSINDDE